MVVLFFCNIFFGYLHLWYLPATLLSAVLVYVNKDLEIRVAVSVLAALYLIGCFVQYLGNYHYFSGVQMDSLVNNVIVYRNFLFFGLPMFGAGYLMASHRVGDRLSAKSKSAFLVVGLVLLCVEFFQNLYFGVSNDEGFDILYSVPIVASSLLLLVMSSCRITESAILANSSSVIYFVHPLFFIFLRKFCSECGPSLITFFAVLLSLLAIPFLLAVNKRFRFVL